MNIAYITTGNIFMNTSANIRNIALITGLVEIGHNVKVVSFENGKPSDQGFEKLLRNINILQYGKKTQSSACKKSKTVQKLKTIILPIYRHFQVYDPYKHSIEEINVEDFNWNDFDICITSSDPKSSHLLAYQARKKGYTFKWVQYWGDPMTLDMTLKTWVGNILKKEEKKLFSAADYVVFTNRTTKNVLSEKYPEFAEKFKDIPTSFCGDIPFLYNKTPKDGYVTLGYYGGCYRNNRNIVPLVHVINTQRNLKLILAGGNDFAFQSNEHLLIYDRVDSKKISELTEQTDILVVLENLPSNKKLGKPCCQIPGKMYHYALMQKPVLVICETELLSNEFGNYDVYYFCKNDEIEITKTIEKIMGDINFKSYTPIEDFLPKNVAKALIDLIT